MLQNFGWKHSHQGIFLCLALYMFACQNGANNQTINNQSEKIIATIGQKKLPWKEIVIFLPAGLSPLDSTNWVNRFTENWIKKQLLAEAADQNLKDLNIQIDKKVEDYRHSLLIHELEKQYINQNLDTNVTNKEIENYYNENMNNFSEYKSKLQAFILRIPQDSLKKHRDKILRLFQGDGTKSTQLLKDYCKKFNVSYKCFDSTWVEISELVRDSPFQILKDSSNNPKKGYFKELAQGKEVFMLKVLDTKLSNFSSPISSVSFYIKSLIIQQRKTQLIKKMEEELYQKAKKSNKFTIYKFDK